MISSELKYKIINCLKPYDPVLIGIFGSYARGENNQNSDIDILVDFKKQVNLFDLISLEIQLKQMIGIKADLVTKRSLHPALKQYIEKDIQVIFND